MLNKGIPSGVLAVKPVIDSSLRGLCVCPYANHPRGCPNFGKKAGCPPNAPLLSDFCDLSQPVWIIYNRFDFGAHCERMRASHPDWTYRQISCCLYWQPTARKQLKRAMTTGLQYLESNGHRDLVITNSPEAMGLNVTETMRHVGIALEWPPKQYTYQIALVGHPKKEQP